MIAQQLLNGLMMGGVYALFALGLSLIFGVQHILNMAHGSVFMWGAFTGLYAMTVAQLPLIVALPIAMLVGGCIGVALDLVAFRPLRKRGASEFAALVSSIGANLILVSLAQQVSRTKVMRFPFDTVPAEAFDFLGMRITVMQLSILALVGLIVAGLFYYIYLTSIGRQIRAVAVNERAANLLGVNPMSVYLQLFFISGALAGAAGVIIGIAFNSVHFLMGEPVLLRAFVVIVLGGMGSVVGAVIAGLVLGMIQAVTVAFVSSELSDVILFALLFLMLMVRPAGFFPGLRQDLRVVRR